jgi:glycine/D-amino acid oxidase-like deaminating enzyme
LVQPKNDTTVEKIHLTPYLSRRMQPALSIWEKESFFAPQDFIIAGGGLVGLWTALEIRKKHSKAKITIIERSTIPQGASTRNAGFACFGSPTEMLHDAALLGEDDMWKIVEMRYKGIRKIRKTFEDKQIDFDKCGGYECLKEDKHNIDEIGSKLSWLNKGLEEISGEKKSFVFSNEKLLKFNFSGFDAMIENKHEGGLHSGKLVQALIKKVHSKGIQILSGKEITGWEDNGKAVSVKTDSFQMIGKKLIVCTNALSVKFLPGCNLKPARGQVLLTAPIKGLKMKGTFHYDEGFYYFRNLGKRILIGGARNAAFAEEETSEMITTEGIQQNLEQFLKTHIKTKHPYEITHRWSGIMGLTATKLPLVEQISNNIIAVVACNGMGVALSPIIAEEVAVKIDI